MRAIDLTGQKFAMLTVIERANNCGNRHAMWRCKCECGNEVVLVGTQIRTGRAISCGCDGRKRTKQSRTKHGMSRSRLYRTWCSMKLRCHNENSKAYRWYGKRGISVCEEWRNSFEVFCKWALSHGYTDELTIDRIDTNGNYEPSNCQWITMSENSIKSNMERKNKQ